MSFLRQLWKQKPEAWGPVEEVQASLFKRAEAIGVDASKIVLALPFWNPGTQVNYGSIPIISNQNEGIFTGPGIYLDGTNTGGHLNFVDNPAWTPATKLSVFIKFSIMQAPTKANAGIISHWVGDGSNNRSWAIYVPQNTTKCSSTLSVSGASVSSTINGAVDLGIDSDIAVAMAFSGGTVNRLYINNTMYTGANVASLYNANAPLQIGSQYAKTDSLTFTNFALNATFKSAIILNGQTITTSQVASLSDNPYQLWQRVAPVSYFILGSTPGGVA